MNYYMIIVQVRYITIETKEVVRIGYKGFLFQHSYSGEGLCATSFVSIVLYLIQVKYQSLESVCADWLQSHQAYTYNVILTLNQRWYNITTLSAGLSHFLINNAFKIYCYENSNIGWPLVYQRVFHISSKFDFFIGVSIIMCHAWICVKEIYQSLTW